MLLGVINKLVEPLFALTSPFLSIDDSNKVIKNFILTSFKEGINKIPEDKTSLEIWELKNNKLKIVK